MWIVSLVPVGKKKQVTYRIVVKKKKAGRNNKVVEVVGESNSYGWLRRWGYFTKNNVELIRLGIKFHPSVKAYMAFFRVLKKYNINLP